MLPSPSEHYLHHQSLLQERRLIMALSMTMMHVPLASRTQQPLRCSSGPSAGAFRTGTPLLQTTAVSHQRRRPLRQVCMPSTGVSSGPLALGHRMNHLLSVLRSHNCR